MKTSKHLILATLLSVAFIYPTTSKAVDSCGGYSSSGNPFPCCTHKDGTAGNCTWWAWKKSKGEWGEAPVSKGNAGTWSSKISKNFAVSSSVKTPSIAESSGHVAWVTGSYEKCLSKDKKGKCTKYETRITGSEMNCPDAYQAQGSFDYKASSYKYIYKK